jgi:hypothetical protein
MEFKLPAGAGVGVGVALDPPPSPAHADINKERRTTQQHPVARRYNMGNSCGTRSLRVGTRQAFI